MVFVSLFLMLGGLLYLLRKPLEFILIGAGVLFAAVNWPYACMLVICIGLLSWLWQDARIRR